MRLFWEKKRSLGRRLQTIEAVALAGLLFA
jgi:hypothetical protein